MQKIYMEKNANDAIKMQAQTDSIPPYYQQDLDGTFVTVMIANFTWGLEEIKTVHKI